MINRRTFESGAAISWSDCAVAFFVGSSAKPKNVKWLHAAARTSGEFSPMPAVNTNASIPFNAASMEPIPDRSRCTNTSNASWARSFPLFHGGYDFAHVG